MKLKYLDLWIVMIGFLIFCPYSIRGSSSNQGMKIAFRWHQTDGLESKSKTIFKCFKGYVDIKFIDLNQKKGLHYIPISPNSSNEDLLSILRTSGVKLFVSLKPGQQNKNLIELEIIDCDTKLTMAFSQIPFIPDNPEAFCTALKNNLDEAIRYKRSDYNTLVFFEHPELNVNNISMVHVQRACFLVAEEVLRLTKGIYSRPPEFRTEYFRHPAVREGLYERIFALSIYGFEDNDGKPHVKLKVKTLDSKNNLLDENELVIPENQLYGFFFSEFVELFDFVSQADAETVQENFRVFASAHTKIGSWKHSTILAEALILLNPAAPVNNNLIWRTYLNWFDRPLTSVLKTGRWDSDNPEFQREIFSRSGSYIRMLSLLTSAINEKELDPEEGAKAFSQSATRALYKSIPFIIDDGERIGEKFLSYAEKAEEAFLLKTYPQPWANQITNNWQKWFMDALLTRGDRTYKTPDDLNIIYKAITEVLPDYWETSHDMTQWLEYAWKIKPAHDKNFTEGEYIDFLMKLIESVHSVARLYGKYGMIRLTWADGQLSDIDELKELQQYIIAFMEEFSQTPYSEGIQYSRTREGMYDRLELIHQRIIKKLQPPQTDSSSSPRPKIIKPEPPKPDTSEYTLVFNKPDIRVLAKDREPVAVQDKRWRAYSGSYGITNVTPCGKELDVFWQAGAILFMKKKGILEEVIVDPGPVFEDVCWNGEHVLVATRNNGVWVISTKGEILRKVTVTDDLPAADKGMRIYAVKKGEIIAVGSHGLDNMAWCAKIVIKENKPATVRVFHRAERIVNFVDNKYDYNMDLCFRPVWLKSYHAGKENKSFLLVGRHTNTLTGRRKPLMIDLKTLEVSVFSAELVGAGHMTKNAYFSSKKGLWEIGDYGMVFYAHPNGTDPDNQLPKTLKVPEREDGGRFHFFKHVLEFNGELFIPGSSWFRMDPNHMILERMCHPEMKDRYQYFQYSSHYGLLIWGFNNTFMEVVPVD